MNRIEQWIIDNLPVTVQRRTKDTLLKCKCPICGDYQANDRKNRQRAAFIVSDDSIHYNCFNDQRCGRGITLNNLAYITCRFKNISFDAAKAMLGHLSMEFIESDEYVEKYRPEVEIENVSVPGNSIETSGVKWLYSRGIANVDVIKKFKQKWSTIYYPLTYKKQVYGYKEMGIKKKWYKTVTDDNEINGLLVGIDDITRNAKMIVVVESVLDALLITQDSNGVVVGLSMDGAVMNDDRIKLLDSLNIEYVMNPDSDKTGIRLIEKLKLDNPDMMGVFFPDKYKDYGEYRSEHGGIAALSYLTSNKCKLSSPKLDLMRVDKCCLII